PGAFCVCDASKFGLLLSEGTGALVGTKQIATFHPRQTRAAFAVGSNLAVRTNGQFAFAYVSNALERRSIFPDVLKTFATQVSRRHRQLHTRVNIAIG